MTAESIDDLAAEVGYPDPAAFRRSFRELAGTSPAEYRRRFANLVPSGQGRTLSQDDGCRVLGIGKSQVQSLAPPQSPEPAVNDQRSPPLRRPQRACPAVSTDGFHTIGLNEKHNLNLHHTVSKRGLLCAG